MNSANIPVTQEIHRQEGTHIARGGANVDQAGGGGRVGLKGVDVRHHVVPAPLLLDGDGGEGGVADDELAGHGLHGGGADAGQAELALGLGQPEPQLAPGAGAPAGREDGLHLRACAAVSAGSAGLEMMGTYWRSARPAASGTRRSATCQRSQPGWCGDGLAAVMV